jgi:hypothetical protein
VASTPRLDFEIFARDRSAAAVQRAAQSMRGLGAEVTLAQGRVSRANLEASRAVQQFGRSSQQAVQAQARLVQAEERAAAATRRLEAAQRLARGAADQDAAAQERLRRSTQGAGDEAGGAGGRFAVLKDNFGKATAAAAGLAAGIAVVGKVIKEGLSQGLVEANARVALGTEGFARMSTEANSTANSLGLTRSEFLASAGQAAILAKNMGFGSDVATKFGSTLPDLSNRLSLMSSGTISAAEASDTLRSALAGEFDPLQAVGISITATTVATKALTIQQANAGKLSTQQATSLAVLAIVQEQTARQAGVLSTAEGRQAQQVAATTAQWRGYWQELEKNVAPKLVTAGDALVKWNAYLMVSSYDPSGVDNYAKALQDANAALGVGGTIVKGYAAAVAGATDKVKDATWSEQAYMDALDTNKNALLKLSGGEAAYWASVDESSKALKENGRTLDLHTEKGRSNRRALDDQAKASLDYLGTIRQQPGSAALFNSTLDQQRARLVRTAISFGMSKAQAQQYARLILGIPHLAVTNVRLNGLHDVLNGFNTLVNRIAWVNGHSVNIQVSAGAANVRESRSRAQARGGIIPGPPSMADTVPAFLSTGEYVINAASTSRYRGTLDAINANRYAVGGYVTSRGPAGGGSVATVLEVVGDDRALVDLIRRLVRIHGGGSAEQTFGWN